MAGEDLDLHTMVQAGTGVPDAVAIGCEGYVVAAVRAAALPASAPSAALAPARDGQGPARTDVVGVAPCRGTRRPASAGTTPPGGPIDTTTRGLGT